MSGPLNFNSLQPHYNINPTSFECICGFSNIEFQQLQIIPRHFNSLHISYINPIRKFRLLANQLKRSETEQKT